MTTMISVYYTHFRNNMKKHLDIVTEDCEPVTVTRKENKNVVIISEKAYNNLLENAYLTGSKANYDWFMESVAQHKAGKARRHRLAEDTDE